MQSRVSWVTEVGLLAAFITITGMFKLPSLFPGMEFQLSAPLAVAICVVFGFSKYITAGLLSSVVGLILGTQTVLNVFIALIFRFTVGIILLAFGRSWPVVMLAGPVGSAVARLALGGIVGKAVIPLLAAAVPGMIFTAVLACPLTAVLRRIKEQRKVTDHVMQR